LQLELAHDALVGRRLVDLAAALALALRDVHRDVGVAEQLLGRIVACPAVRERDAEARPRVDLLALDAERLLERAHDPPPAFDRLAWRIAWLTRSLKSARFASPVSES